LSLPELVELVVEADALEDGEKRIDAVSSEMKSAEAS